MANMDNLPFEVNYEHVKQSLIRTINQIADSEQMPSSLMIIVLENVLQEFKLNTYSTIIGNYDISIPEGAVVNQKTQTKQVTDPSKQTNKTIDLVPDEIKNGDIPIVDDKDTEKSK